MRVDIQEHRLSRVVVAACSPSLHELTFRRTLSRAGLNPYLLEHCNIREPVSWVTESRELATGKAFRLVRAAVARASRLVPLEKRRLAIHPSALLIGGGVAGLIAARDLASRGIEVTLLESTPFLGGRLAQLHRIYPSGARAVEDASFHWTSVPGYLATLALLGATSWIIRDRRRKRDQIHKESDLADWLFVVFLFLTSLSGILLPGARMLDLALATYVFYVVHLRIAVAMLVVEVPVSKWSHLLYRPLALYLLAVRRRAAQASAVEWKAAQKPAVA